MNQEERSLRSRTQVLDAALALFSHQGYRATSMRDIADKAGVSTGNVYHHFKDKESIFRELLDQYWRAIADPDFPVNRALRTGTFPENLEAIGPAARHSVAQRRPPVGLVEGRKTGHRVGAGFGVQACSAARAGSALRDAVKIRLTSLASRR